MKKRMIIVTKDCDRSELKVVKRILKAYKELDLISEIKKISDGFEILTTREIYGYLKEEIKYSFREAGLC